MARYNFGGTLSAWVFTAQDASVQYGAGAQVARLAPGATVTGWSALTGGTQYTDLLDASSSAVTSITASSTGDIPPFQGPDGITFMWLDAGAGRKRINSNDGITGPAGTNGTNGTNGVDGVNGTNGAPGPGLAWNLEVGGVYPGRPVTATNVPVNFMGKDFPASGGTFAGGTNAVNGDLLFKTPV